MDFVCNELHLVNRREDIQVGRKVLTRVDMIQSPISSNFAFTNLYNLHSPPLLDLASQLPIREKEQRASLRHPNLRGTLSLICPQDASP